MRVFMFPNDEFDSFTHLCEYLCTTIFVLIYKMIYRVTCALKTDQKAFEIEVPVQKLCAIFDAFVCARLQCILWSTWDKVFSLLKPYELVQPPLPSNGHKPAQESVWVAQGLL